MLQQITVKNLAIVAELELNFGTGMHVLTGETGAGKSIIIDALSIALGERASAEQIRAGQTQAEIIASFDVSQLPAVQALLQEQELPHTECVIRRIISNDGRSRAYINGISVAVQQIKTLAPHLVHIHSQHQHHALLESDYQRQVLDVYAEHPQLLAQVAELHAQWLQTKQQILALTAMQQQADRLTLLNYQIQELSALQLQTNELQQLDQKHNQLAKGQELTATCQSLHTLLTNAGEGETSVLDQLHSALNQITALVKIAPSLTPCTEILQQALINVQEAGSELENFYTKLDLDPAQLAGIEQRLSNIYALARKLKVSPELLTEHYAALCLELEQLSQAATHLEQLQQNLGQLETQYQKAATTLTTSRQNAASKLTAEITQRIQTLEMPHAKFTINLEPLKHNNPTPYGNENIHFMVTTNPGQPLGLLKKVASGGELSRLSLAIQVITAQQMATPTLILDEVDVGISGKTAATVGALMRELGANAQILCITHLPQVAAQGHHHFKVAKQQSTADTVTQITPLNRQQRVEELARLMGGATITPEALAHAEGLIEAISV